MPINGILAPSYARIRYQTWASTHRLTLYFTQLGSVVNQPDGTIDVEMPYNTPNGQGNTGNILLSVIVKQLFERTYNPLASVLPSIQTIEFWRSNAIGGEELPNSLIGYVTPPTLVATAGAKTNGIASSFLQFRAVTTDMTIPRQQFQINFYDCMQSAAPQSGTLTVPTTDNTQAPYFLFKWGIPLASQDGYALLAPKSQSSGYNRRLARSYGKTLTP